MSNFENLFVLIISNATDCGKQQQIFDIQHVQIYEMLTSQIKKKIQQIHLSRRLTFIYRNFFFLKSKVFLQSQKRIVNYYLLHQKVCQRISVTKTNTGVFVVFQTKPDLKCQFSGNIECVCFYY